MLGSLVHLPEGHKDASSAAHCPAQLVFLPQAAFWNVVSALQQVTLLVWLALVKTKSKNEVDKEVMLTDSEVQEAASVELPLQASTSETLHLRCRNFFPHSDHSPQSDQAAGSAVRTCEIRAIYHSLRYLDWKYSGTLTCKKLSRLDFHRMKRLLDYSCSDGV